MGELTTAKQPARGSPAWGFVQQQWQALQALRRGERRELPRLWNSLALILGRVASSGLGFLTWIVTARLYTTSEVGIASGIISAMMLCVQLALIGVGSALVAIYPRYQERPAPLVNTALNLVSGAALVGAGLFLWLASALFNELNVASASLGYGLLFGGITLFGTVNVLMDHVSISLRRNDQVFLRNVVFGMVTIVLVGTAPFLTGRHNSQTIVLAWTVAGVSACGIGVFQLYRSIPGYAYRGEVECQVAGKLIRVGVPNYLLTLSERGPNWILPILVTELLSPAQNAHWYTAWMIAWVIFIVPISIGQNLFAEVSRKPEAQQEAIRHSLRASLILGGIAALVVGVLAPWPLRLLGPDYAAVGSLPLRILALAVFPVSLIQAYYAVCRGLGFLGEATLTGVISGGVGVGLAAAVGIHYGLVGMALAWLVTQGLTGVWALVRLRALSGRLARIK